MPAAAVSKILGAAFEHESATFRLRIRRGWRLLWREEAALTVTLKRKGGTLGISVDPNNHQITNVVEGGAGDTAGLCVGDFIAEVNGKSTTGGSFGKLLPAAAMAEIRLRLIRVQVVEPDHLHLPDVLA